MCFTMLGWVGFTSKIINKKQDTHPPESKESEQTDFSFLDIHIYIHM